MARSRLTRLVKVCRICGEGYDGFKSRESRGRFCSATCLTEARRRQRDGLVLEEEPAIGPAMLPPTVILGNRSAIYSLGPDLAAIPDEGPGLTT
ncbi:MAG: hypothetical protein JWM18_1988 [Chloroflexi bacterium]|jgi:hypothetical protein|nr:hypothetical protein [Chloroflexota bacterium]